MNGPMATANNVDNTTETDLRQAISATDLRFANLDRTTAVRNVALDIRKTEFFGFVGSNGARENHADQGARGATDNETMRRVRGKQ